MAYPLRALYSKMSKKFIISARFFQELIKKSDHEKTKLDFVQFSTTGFRGGDFQVGINFEGRVKLTLPDKLISTWESLSRKMVLKIVQSRAKNK